MRKSTGTGMFEGVKVADFAWILAGPLVSSYLASFGATVVRIESADAPDGIRTSAPYKDGVPGINRSGFFGYVNPNKYSMALNLNNPRAMEIAKRLIAWSDIVSENFIPGMMERWGLGYEDLKKIKPDVIMVRNSIQGQTGPWAKRRGVGILATSQAGFSSVTGWPDGLPGTSYIGYTDFVAPRFCATALIAALAYRRRKEKGVCIDISQIEAAMHFLAPVILDYTANGREAKRQGNSCISAAPHGVYRCKGDDRWCAISVSTDEEWKALCKIIGLRQTADSKFATLLSRKHYEEELNRLVEAWTINHTPDEVMRLMQEAGVPAGIVQNIKDLTDDPQLKSRNHLWWMNHPEMGSLPHIAPTIVFSGAVAEPKMPSPCLGEHTEYVCRELLGMSDEEFVSFLGEGVFQ